MLPNATTFPVVFKLPPSMLPVALIIPSTDKDNSGIALTSHWQARKGTETILVVDDEEVIRQLIINSLDTLGYTILEATNGEEALELFNNTKEKIDVLLTDVVMPVMNGRELADKVTELSPETKVIFMSGYTPDIILKKKLVREDTFFMQKPVTPSLLSGKLRLVLDVQDEPVST